MIEKYKKQFDNLAKLNEKEELDSLDLIKLVIEARISRDAYRLEKTQFKSRFVQMKTDTDKFKKSLRKLIKDCDTKTFFTNKDEVEK